MISIASLRRRHRIRLGRAFIREIERQFSQDIPIWENKGHLERPMLCDGDGPIGLIRRWGRGTASSRG